MARKPEEPPAVLQRDDHLAGGRFTSATSLHVTLKSSVPRNFSHPPVRTTCPYWSERPAVRTHRRYVNGIGRRAPAESGAWADGQIALRGCWRPRRTSPKDRWSRPVGVNRSCKHQNSVGSALTVSVFRQSGGSGKALNMGG
jgi:hypothetical protein